MNLITTRGTPRKRTPKGAPLAVRISFHSKEDPKTGCINWTSHRSREGYAMLNYKGASRKVSRLVLKLNGTKLPKHLHALHRCDNPACVNFDHLFVGSDADNVADMWAKGRGLHGEQVTTSKLSERDVRKIKKSTERVIVLAERYGVRFQQIYRIKNGERWGHVQ